MSLREREAVFEIIANHYSDTFLKKTYNDIFDMDPEAKTSQKIQSIQSMVSEMLKMATEPKCLRKTHIDLFNAFSVSLAKMLSKQQIFTELMFKHMLIKAFIPASIAFDYEQDQEFRAFSMIILVINDQIESLLCDESFIKRFLANRNFIKTPEVSASILEIITNACNTIQEQLCPITNTEKESFDPNTNTNDGSSAKLKEKSKLCKLLQNEVIHLKDKVEVLENQLHHFKCIESATAETEQSKDVSSIGEMAELKLKTVVPEKYKESIVEVSKEPKEITKHKTIFNLSEQVRDEEDQQDADYDENEDDYDGENNEDDEDEYDDEDGGEDDQDGEDSDEDDKDDEEDEIEQVVISDRETIYKTSKRNVHIDNIGDKSTLMLRYD